MMYTLIFMNMQDSGIMGNIKFREKVSAPTQIYTELKVRKY